MTEHVILVALTIEAPDREAAERVVADALPSETWPAGLTSYWVAEDDRTDGSDNDSAVFVDAGTQADALALLVRHGLTGRHNLAGISERTSRFDVTDSEGDL